MPKNANKPKTTPKKQIITGYKATDKDIRCRGYQFEVGKWHTHEGDLELCSSGFHFCEQPSGVWSYHNEEGTRAWKIEAREVLVLPREPGADYKLVCRQIRLVEEVKIDGNYNTGNYNTGDRNTGDRNTGDRNTGDYNTGNRNTGNYNTGYCNTGNCNTGNYNTGYCNTGDYNTGDRNTGDYNTGNRNTGYCNATNFSAGYFCAQEPNVICFDVDTGMNRDAFKWNHGGTADRLGQLLAQDDPIAFEDFSSLPGITPEKLLALHKKFIDARKATN